MKNKVFCVVSHTHWDREWYSPIEKFRHRLVDLFDRLLIILDENPDYVFHMDAQTVVLEDYLAVRPEKKEILRQHIQNRRIMVGPWYLQNDFFLTSGESTVRNLLEGKKLCTEFGGKGEIGYAPDQFGNISQLPQILDNFGLDNFVFGRGFNFVEANENGDPVFKTTPTEFIWEGADGTCALAIHMRHWYNNAQRFSADIDKAEKYLQQVVGGFDNEFTLTPYMLLMNGVDHLEPQPDLLPILSELQKRLSDGNVIMQYNFDDYVKDVKEYIKDNDIKPITVKGELRMGGDESVLKGTLSSRHYLKVANVEAQILLENRLEPLFAMLEKQGINGVYPFDHIRYTWKNLMRNHPHDSICGCSRDEIHKHMENRYEEIFEFGNELLARGIQTAADHSDVCRNAGKDAYMLTVANTLAVPVTGAAKVKFEFLKEDGFGNFEIIDEKGNKVPFAVMKSYENRKDIFSPINLPGTLDVDVFETYVDVGTVNPYSFKNFTVKAVAGNAEITPEICCEQKEIENDLLKVAVSDDGKVDITCKKSGRVIKDCIGIEDSADKGDSYIYAFGTDEPVFFDGDVTDVCVIEKNTYKKTLRISYEKELPEYYDLEADKRSDKTVKSFVTIDLTLEKDKPFVQVDYAFDNHSKDHRFRIFVKTDVTNHISVADSAFDIIAKEDTDHFPKTKSKTRPNASFAALQDGNKGFAVLTKGAHEYEHINGNILAFSIVRATAGINANPSDNWKTPGNQCIRVVSGSMALMPFEGDVVSAGVPNSSLIFRAPLTVNASPCDTHKFTGGRPCVQDSSLAEFFYLPDTHPQVAIPSNTPALQISGDGITVTAFKRSEDGSGMILRFVNLSDKTQKAEISVKGKIYRTTMEEVRHHFLGIDKIEMDVTSKKIVTLFID